MEAPNQFLVFLNKFIPLDESEFGQIIQPYVQIREFKKKQIITSAGEVENWFNLIVKGLVRKYFTKGEEEFITQISTEGQIIHSQESFHSRATSDYFVDAIEGSTLLSISYENLNTILAVNAKTERLGRLIVTYLLVLTGRWQMSWLKLSPRERFLNFMQNNPELQLRTPQKYLASLLNIQPETFSRFKHLVKR